MARIRTIKPDAFASDSLSQVPIRARWTFAGLWTFADDDGRARADARLIKAYVYPLDDDLTARDVEADLEALEQVGCIRRYEAGGKRYLCMPGWSDHQKISHPAKSKIPPPPESSGNPPEPSGSFSGPGTGPFQAAGASPNGSDGTRTALNGATSQQQQIPAAGQGQTDITAGQGTSPQSSVNPPETLQSPPETLRPEVEREREEEREEDLKAGGTHSAPPRSGGPKRGTRLPEDWEPDRDLKQWTLDEGMTADQARHTVEDFRDYWCSKTGRDATKTDWSRTWKRWVREELRRGTRRSGQAGRPTSASERSAAVLDDYRQRLAANRQTDPAAQQAPIWPASVPDPAHGVVDGTVIETRWPA